MSVASVASVAMTAIAAVLASGCAFGGGESTRAADSIAPFPRPFQIIAHRGGAGHAPENTLAAFRRSRELGVAEVELDVQLTSDDQLVIFHDDTLAAKTGASGRVRDHTLAELTRLDIGSWFDANAKPNAAGGAPFAGTRLDSLESLFSEMGRAFFYHVELKDDQPGLSAPVLAMIDRFGLRDRVMITSFHFEQLQRMQALAPSLPTCFLIDVAGNRSQPIEAWIERAAEAGFSEVGVAAQELTRAQVALARGRGLWIRAWRVRNADDMERAIAAGSNGMTIDFPDQLMRRFLDHAGSAGALEPR